MDPNCLNYLAVPHFSGFLWFCFGLAMKLKAIAKIYRMYKVVSSIEPSLMFQAVDIIVHRALELCQFGSVPVKKLSFITSRTT